MTVRIYKEVSDYLLEDGFYTVFKTDSGWSIHAREAKEYTIEEAQALCSENTDWKVL